MTFQIQTVFVHTEVLNLGVYRIFIVIFCIHHSDSGAISHQNLSTGKRFTNVSARARTKNERGRRRENRNVLRNM